MIHRRLLGFALLITLVVSVKAQTQRIDTTAVYILQQTSATIQDLKSCSFTSEAVYDVWSDDLGLVKHSHSDDVVLKFPDKFKIKSDGDKGRRSLWYNGNTLSYYSYINNQYAEIPAPASIIQTVDTVSKTYGVEFPAADFFYPSFVQDIIDTGGNLIYLGMTIVNGQSCFHIAGKDANSSFQFWVSDDDLFLPIKMVVIYSGEKGSPQYEATYSNWQLNTDYTDTMFEFTAPPKAAKIKFAPVQSTSK